MRLYTVNTNANDANEDFFDIVDEGKYDDNNIVDGVYNNVSVSILSMEVPSTGPTSLISTNTLVMDRDPHI